MDNVEEPNTQEESTHAESLCAATQGVEEISMCDENEDDTDQVDGGGCNFSPETALNCTDDLGKLNIKEIGSENVMKFHFPDVAVAFAFYNWYACMNGFAARKGHVLRNCNGEIIQQTFLCHREGHKEVKHNHPESRRRRPKPVTRCGCKARCILHIEANNGRWYIKYFSDVHNHTLVENGYSSMISAHRKMTEYDKFQMNGMREVGISTPHIFGLFAIQAGGFEKVGFNKRDMYNEQLRQRRHHFLDAKAALDFLEDLGKKDSMMFWRHTVDEDGRLEHLFWCDGVARSDFSVFGDVLAFDATYGKNRYKCPLVVFSGINHHIQSIVFGAAIVANETEETYVWLLEQLLAAMGGKSPDSVITDGDLAMKNAITRVFPRARHRLCAWHLIRNATSNVKNPQFVSRFKQCMLGDYDVGEFNCKWDEMVSDFGLEENTWVTEMYQKRRMWATAYIRGNFFAGFRTTSRCEGLHSEFGKYVNHQHNLLDFLKHFFRWLSYMRYREVESDFSSSYGELVLETHLKFLERSAANVFTKEVFLLFRPVLERALTCKVEGTRQTATCFMYKVCRYHKEGLEWCVSFCPTSLQFRCSCERMESLGIPCEHLVSVMVHLDIIQLPPCLVLVRWTKAAKDSIGLANKDTSRSRDASLISQYLYLVERCKRMANAALDCEQSEYMRKTIDMVDAHTAVLESVRLGDNVAATDVDSCPEGIVRNPLRVRTKGCGAAPSLGQKKGKKASRKTHTCGVCGQKGHNRKSCHVHSQTTLLSQTQAGSSVGHLDEDNGDEDFFYATIDTNVTNNFQM